MTFSVGHKPQAPTLDQQIRDLWSTLRESATTAPTLASIKEPAVKAIRYLEAELVRVLDGGRLLGLPNLGSTDLPLRGARLRGTIDAALPRLERDRTTPWTLILSESGRLEQVRAERVDRHEFELVVRAVEDNALVVEDLPGFVVVLGTVLPRHQDGTNTKARWLNALEALAVQASTLKLGA